MVRQKHATKESVPQWVRIAAKTTPLILQRLEVSLNRLNLPLQVRTLPLQAFWFLNNSLFLANEANRAGMHANALSITRQCLEAISVIELGLSKMADATALLHEWERDERKAGEIRKWLATHAWPTYGQGVWSESWTDFMSNLAKAIQPYAHYSTKLAQWQGRLYDVEEQADKSLLAKLQMGPRVYDPQKATRITLYHALLTFALARIWLATHGSSDNEFRTLVEKFRIALGKTVYLDGEQTVWEQQFWAMLFFLDRKQKPE
jgi:hypothetical protein